MALSAVALLTSACSSTAIPYKQTISVDELLDAAKVALMHGDMSDYVFIANTLHIEVQPGTPELTKLSDGTPSSYETKYKLLKFDSAYQADGFSYESMKPNGYGLFGSRLSIICGE
jgi:hypothetical protein